MLLFLATVLEQLDVALEHVLKRDVHNARFGLMLTDNAVELVLHRIAKDRAAELKAWSHSRETYEFGDALHKAMGRSFEAKVKFAKLEKKLEDELAQTISIIHTYRNEVYHVGLEHEAILPTLATFHFDVACKFVMSYEPFGLSWASNLRLPERAKKYFNGDTFLPGKLEDYQKGCETLAHGARHDSAQFIEALADHMDEVVNDQDACLDIVAGGVYKGQQITRDKAIIDSQAWPLAFSEEGKTFANQHGWGGGSVFNFVEWIGAHYPLKYRADPITSWQKRAAALRSEKNSHSALNRYHSFMIETAVLREALSDSAMQVEAEIDAAIDRLKEERAFQR